MSVNKQIIIGNLGKDPDVRTMDDGSKVCRFTVAVTKKGYTAQNGTQVPDHTEWFNIYCKGKKAEVAGQYLHKGDRVYIEGETYTGEYTSQQGQKVHYTQVNCEVLEFLNDKSQQQGFQPQGFQPAPAQQGFQQPIQQFVPQAATQVQSMPQYQQQPAQQQQFAPAAMPTGVFGQPVQPVQEAPAPAGPQWP